MAYLTKCGTYTPTLTNVTNISASTAYVCQYMKCGRVVTVSGRVDIDQATPGTIELGISLPFASNFSAVEQCTGTGVGNASGDDPGYIKADTVNDRASFNMKDTDATNHPHYFHFTYLIV